VVLVGAGFGGLYAAQALKRAPVDLTVIDRRQLSSVPAVVISSGHRRPVAGRDRFAVAARAEPAEDTRVWMAEARDIDVERRRVRLDGGEAAYDTLVLAPGWSSRHYFSHDDWAPLAPGLKTMEDATEIRRRILLAF